MSPESAFITQTVRVDGSQATASGLVPTFRVATTAPVAPSKRVAVLVAPSVEMTRVVPGIGIAEWPRCVVSRVGVTASVSRSTAMTPVVRAT